MFSVDPMHAARLAQLEGALLALLRESVANLDPNDAPDGVTARLDGDGLDLEYSRAGRPVAGEGL